MNGAGRPAREVMNELMKSIFFCAPRKLVQMRCSFVSTLGREQAGISHCLRPAEKAPGPCQAKKTRKTCACLLRCFQRRAKAFRLNSTPTEHAPPSTSSRSRRRVPGFWRGETGSSALTRARPHPRSLTAIRGPARPRLAERKTKNWPNPRSYEGTYEERAVPRTLEFMKELMNFITRTALAAPRETLLFQI